MRSASLPSVCPVYLCANVGPRGATHCSACPILCHSESSPPGLSVRECGPQGLVVVRLPAPFIPHSASLGPARATRVLSAPVPVSAPPTGLDECLFFISLASDFLAVLFSVSSGCTRSCSVSTYAAILVLLFVKTDSDSKMLPNAACSQLHACPLRHLQHIPHSLHPPSHTRTHTHTNLSCPNFILLRVSQNSSYLDIRIIFYSLFFLVSIPHLIP